LQVSIKLTNAQAMAHKLLTYVGTGRADINVPQLEVINVPQLNAAKVAGKTLAADVKEIFNRLCKDNDSELPCLLTRRTKKEYSK
jgi:hypothetical protein